jgi:hypothetical protein
VFGITRVSSGRCGAVSIDLDELITNHYGITHAEVALIAGAAGPGVAPQRPALITRIVEIVSNTR